MRGSSLSKAKSFKEKSRAVVEKLNQKLPSSSRIWPTPLFKSQQTAKKATVSLAKLSSGESTQHNPLEPTVGHASLSVTESIWSLSMKKGAELDSMKASTQLQSKICVYSVNNLSGSPIKPFQSPTESLAAEKLTSVLDSRKTSVQARKFPGSLSSGRDISRTLSHKKPRPGWLIPQPLNEPKIPVQDENCGTDRFHSPPTENSISSFRQVYNAEFRKAVRKRLPSSRTCRNKLKPSPRLNMGNALKDYQLNDIHKIISFVESDQQLVSGKQALRQDFKLLHSYSQSSDKPVNTGQLSYSILSLLGKCFVIKQMEGRAPCISPNKSQLGSS
jgi:hypothetical protein